MATLIVHRMHRASGNRWAALLSNVVLNLVLHPVLIDSLRAGLRGALITTGDRVTVLDLHLEHATLVLGSICTRRLEATWIRNGVLRMRTTEVAGIHCTLRGRHRCSRWVILQQHGVRTLIKRIVIAIQLTRDSRSVCACSARDTLILHIRHILIPIIVALRSDWLLQCGRNHILNVVVEASSSHLLLVSGVDWFGLVGLHRGI